MESNNAKLREALEFIKLANDDYKKYGTTKAGALDAIYEKACAALAAPPRNCDAIPADKLVDEFCNRFMESCEGVDDQEAIAQYKQLFMQIHLQDFAHWIAESYESEVSDGSK